MNLAQASAGNKSPAPMTLQPPPVENKGNQNPNLHESSANLTNSAYDAQLHYHSGSNEHIGEYKGGDCGGRRGHGHHFCTLCQKHGHDYSYCYYRPEAYSYGGQPHGYGYGVPKFYSGFGPQFGAVPSHGPNYGAYRGVSAYTPTPFPPSVAYHGGPCLLPTPNTGNHGANYSQSALISSSPGLLVPMLWQPQCMVLVQQEHTGSLT
ncbi:hypothetical protein RIF29_38078 [Crotalaria pallida]|uniref:Uncharacterized protein n=1 Tax=Crotalaria pallida TaxID=3830 RepID=A0AAN9HL74_CROPI